MNNCNTLISQSEHDVIPEGESLLPPPLPPPPAVAVGPRPPRPDGAAPRLPVLAELIRDVVAVSKQVLGLVIGVILEVGQPDQVPEALERLGQDELLLEQPELLGLDGGDAGDDLVGQHLVQPELLLLDLVDGDLVVVAPEQLVVIVLELVHVEGCVLGEGVSVPVPPRDRGARQYPDVAAGSECLLE